MKTIRISTKLLQRQVRIVDELVGNKGFMPGGKRTIQRKLLDLEGLSEFLSALSADVDASPDEGAVVYRGGEQ